MEDIKLTNKELSEKCHVLIDDFCKNGKKSKLWYMSIPARPNDDADLLMSQLLHRFESQQADLLESYKAIMDNSYSRTRSGDFICTQCEKTAYLLKKINHNSDCIVLKAENFIKEHE